MKRLILIVSIILATTVSLKAQQTRFSSGTAAQASILRFYPNPATTVVNFDFQRIYDKGFSLQVYNFLGKKMFEEVNIPERATINLTEFSRGVYIYQLRDKNNQLVESGKFQVAK